jgi:lambda family phage tail tape measure protein
MAQATQIRQIRIQVDTKGDQNLKAIADKLGSVNKNVKSLSSSFGFLKNAFVGYFSALGVGELVRMSDTMQLLNSRIAVLSGGTEQAKNVLTGLLGAANRTKTSIDGLADVYARLSASTKETGISTSTLLDLTEVLQNTFRLSGAGAQEANSAAIQLSQGFASGQLRGQELRSVLEANVVIGDILSKTFGVTRGELYKLAEAGNLTASKVMVALLKSMGDVNGRAGQLATTFEGTLTKAMNGFKIKILEINEEFGLSSKFATGMDLFVEKMGLIGVAIVAVALTQLPLLIKGIQTLTTAARAFAVANPYVLIFTAIATAIVLSFDNLKQFTDFLKFTYQEVMKFFNMIGQFFAKLDLTMAKTPDQIRRAKSALDDLQKSYAERSGKQDALFAPSPEDLKAQEEAMKAAKQRAADLKKLQDMAGKGGKAPKIKELYAALNKSFQDGKISIDDYYMALEKLDMKKVTDDFRNGKITLDKYNLALEEVKKKNIQREYQQGALSLDEFNKAIARVNLAELDIKFRAGQITLLEYRKELYAIKAELSVGGAMQKGIYDFVESLGTVGSNIADATKAAFGSLEESLNDFIKTGSADFKKFAQGVLDDIQKIIIRAAIIRPLADGIMGAFSGGATTGLSAGGSYGGSYGTVAAKGAAFDSGVRMFAKGGIVSQPTPFTYGGGQKGLMGEAGSEAILPLTRGKNGNLGVEASVAPVQINVINNGDVNVETREREGSDGRVVDMIITRKVQEGLANGSFDRAMGSAYGLKRRGN